LLTGKRMLETRTTRSRCATDRHRDVLGLVVSVQPLRGDPWRSALGNYSVFERDGEAVA